MIKIDNEFSTDFQMQFAIDKCGTLNAIKGRKKDTFQKQDEDHVQVK